MTSLRMACLLSLVLAVIGFLPAASYGGWDLTTSDTHILIDVVKDQEVIALLGHQASTQNNWIGEPMSVPWMSKVWLDGREVAVKWRFKDGAADKTSGKLTLVFTNEEPKLLLRSIWRGRAGRGPVEHWAEIENLSGRRVTVSHQDSLSLRGLKAIKQADIWWIKRGASHASVQGGVFRQPLDDKLDLRLNSDCHDGASPVPWLAVQAGAEEGLYVGWEFSGLGRIHVRAAKGSGRFDLDVGNHPEFRTDVEPGEVFLVPTALVGCYAGDVDEGSYSLHRFVLEKLRPPFPERYPDPILVYNFYLDGGGPNAKEDDVLRGAHTCRELGCEAFMPDAMWFPQVGDWRWDPRRFPAGIAPIEKYVHDHGMRMALWCAWTLGGSSTDPGALTVRGPVGRPQWFDADFAPNWNPPATYDGGHLCLACAEAKQWAIEKTQQLVAQYKVDYLKHDSHPIAVQCNKKSHRHRYGVDVSYWATMGYYEVQEKLRQAYPRIILENCSGAGHIKDFGVIQRTHYTPTTDTLSNLPDRQGIYDSTYALPPLVLQAYTYDNGYPGVKGDTPGTFLWRSGMMSAWQIDPTDTGKWGEKERQSVKRSVQVYKEWIRPMLQDCKVHHVLPRPDGVHWDGLFYWSAKLQKGTLYIFRPESGEGEKTVKLKGLDPEKEYWVWCEDGSVRLGARLGKELMEEGLTIRLPRPYTSDLVFLQDASLGKPTRGHNAFSE